MADKEGVVAESEPSPLVGELRTMAERLNELADRLAEEHGLQDRRTEDRRG